MKNTSCPPKRPTNNPRPRPQISVDRPDVYIPESRPSFPQKGGGYFAGDTSLMRPRPKPLFRGPLADAESGPMPTEAQTRKPLTIKARVKANRLAKRRARMRSRKRRLTIQ